MRTAFRPQFWRDVEDGVAYLAERASAETAAAWHKSVFATTRLIEGHPGIGRRRPGLRPEGIRSFRLKEFAQYLIFYRTAGSELEFLRVKHGRMDLPPLFSPG